MMEKKSSKTAIKTILGMERNRIKILFICHGNILKSPGKARKINGSAKQKGVYYTTTTPFVQ